MEGGLGRLGVGRSEWGGVDLRQLTLPPTHLTGLCWSGAHATAPRDRIVAQTQCYFEIPLSCEVKEEMARATTGQVVASPDGGSLMRTIWGGAPYRIYGTAWPRRAQRDDGRVAGRPWQRPQQVRLPSSVCAVSHKGWPWDVRKDSVHRGAGQCMGLDYCTPRLPQTHKRRQRRPRGLT